MTAKDKKTILQLYSKNPGLSPSRNINFTKLFCLIAVVIKAEKLHSNSVMVQYSDVMIYFNNLLLFVTMATNPLFHKNIITEKGNITSFHFFLNIVTAVANNFHQICHSG